MRRHRTTDSRLPPDRGADSFTSATTPVKGGASAIGAKIDDLGIWRRALTAEEARAIYLAGLAGRDLSQATVDPRLVLTRQPGSVQLTWSGDPRNQLETTSDLTDQKWSKVPGGTGTNTVSLPVEAPPAFFRVVP